MLQKQEDKIPWTLSVLVASFFAQSLAASGKPHEKRVKSQVHTQRESQKTTSKTVSVPNCGQFSACHDKSLCGK